MIEPNKINYKDYLSIDESIKHSPYEQELSYFEAIKRGDINFLNNHPATIISENHEGLGILSDNAYKNQLYHFIIGTALATRFCVDGGMEFDAAYSLSDYYIRKADKTTSTDEIKELYQLMVVDFATRMKSTNNKYLYSKPIVLSLDYIYNHLHEKITVNDISKYVNLNPSYFSKLFKKEYGIPVSEYITGQRLSAAKNMLKYSDYSFSEISSSLMFASQSYFIKVFKEDTGLTPKEYRNRYFRKRFVDN